MLYGSSLGLIATGNQFWTQDSPGVADSAEAGLQTVVKERPDFLI